MTKRNACHADTCMLLWTLCRLLRAMDFQPRLGVVTRALQLAGPDLLHFFLVAGSVFLCYCVMGYLIFGNSLPWFATLGNSINTCFEMLLGEFADVNADLRALGGLQVGRAWVPSLLTCSSHIRLAALMDPFVPSSQQML